MTPSADDYAEAVANGAALLDARVPGWRDRVDVAELDLSDCVECTLGQVFGAYQFGLTRLDLSANDWDEEQERAATYGFTLLPALGEGSLDDRSAHWSALRDAWIKAIQ